MFHKFRLTFLPVVDYLFRVLMFHNQLKTVVIVPEVTDRGKSEFLKMQVQ